MDPRLKSADLPGSSDFPVAVVIPTYNRADALITCLEHLEKQTYKDFEVIVVDDGSTDETAQKVREYQKRTHLSAKFFQQANAGPARARNVAIAAARSPLVLMIGDDIFATPVLVETHLKLHARRPELSVAGLGLTVWEEKHQKVTPFMRFLEHGTQFAYAPLLAGQKPDAGAHFYSSNLSVKTELLRRNPFCERFPAAAIEDSELGYRIERTDGLDLIFIPDALAHHYHPTTFLQACRRMRRVGWSAHLFHEIWPDSYSDPAGKTGLRRIVRDILAPAPVLFLATQLSSALSNLWAPAVLFRAVLGTHFYLGYRDRETETRASGRSSSVSLTTGS